MLLIKYMRVTKQIPIRISKKSMRLSFFIISAVRLVIGKRCEDIPYFPDV
jgi:hypothetical protein